eukprot:COSAG02_NODE_299_length_25349_cov_53.762020_19_plen_98_part_00
MTMTIYCDSTNKCTRSTRGRGAAWGAAARVVVELAMVAMVAMASADGGSWGLVPRRVTCVDTGRMAPYAQSNTEQYETSTKYTCILVYLYTYLYTGT